MTGKTERRVREIRRRIRRYRRKQDIRTFSCLTAFQWILLTGISLLLQDRTPSNMVLYANGYSTVLLQDGADFYVVIGILFFVLGVALTIGWIRWHSGTAHRISSADSVEYTEKE